MSMSSSTLSTSCNWVSTSFTVWVVWACAAANKDVHSSAETNILFIICY